jgi:hypothetical protein
MTKTNSALLVLAVLAAAALPAQAQTVINCSSLPQPVYLQGTSTATPLMAALGRALAAATPPRETIVFKASSTCDGVAAIAGGGSPLLATATFWDASGNQMTCNIDQGGVPADVGVSGVFAPSCALTLPGGVADLAGPVDPLLFVVRLLAPPTAISANAAYFVYGFGAAGMVTPWNNDLQIIALNSQSATQIILGKAIGVPATQWKGVQNSSAGSEVTTLISLPPDKTIGILPGDAADATRQVLRGLAFQSDSTSCAVTADSSSTSFDKANVRAGAYPLWGRLHYLVRVDASGQPVSPAVADVVGVLTGARPGPAGFSEVDSEIAARLVPQCAMRVSRSVDAGPLAPFTPADACGCYFEQKANGTTTCPVCTVTADCAAGKACHRGFCE